MLSTPRLAGLECASGDLETMHIVTRDSVRIGDLETMYIVTRASVRNAQRVSLDGDFLLYGHGSTAQCICNPLYVRLMNSLYEAQILAGTSLTIPSIRSQTGRTFSTW